MSSAAAPGSLTDMGLRLPVTLGITVIAVFFGGFLGWAALAPLGSAAIAVGIVSVESNRKTVQHLEGGIVGRILVKDGDTVAAGQVLVVLDETQPRASLDLLRVRVLAANALKYRLMAERDNAAAIRFPEQLTARHSDPKVAEIIAGQVNILAARRDAQAGQVAILKQQINQLSEEINGLKGMIGSENTRIKLIGEEITDLSGLVQKGLAPRRQLRALQRRQAEIEGSMSQNRSRIAEAMQTIAQTRLQIVELTTAKINEVTLELRDVQGELYDLEERARAAEDILRRTEIRAPLQGTVVNLQVHTAGGVIAPGAALLDIVPSQDRLIIEARVNPIDIDMVHVGLKAQARFTALSQRRTQPVEGIVTALSADRLVDQRSGEDYFLARVEITDDLTKKLGGATLLPGMQAEVMIVTGERTALEYFLKPLTSSINRAFREE